MVADAGGRGGHGRPRGRAQGGREADPNVAAVVVIVVVVVVVLVVVGGQPVGDPLSYCRGCALGASLHRTGKPISN